LLVLARYAALGKLGNAIETGGREADDRIHPSRHFFEHDKAVAAAQLATGRSGRPRAGRGRFSGLRRVVTGSDGLCARSVSCAWLGVTDSVVSTTWGD
jgi:hypothetical protein